VPILERNSILVNLTLAGLAIYFIIDLPSREMTLRLFGTPLTLLMSQRWLLVVLLVGLVCTGIDGIIRSHPKASKLKSGEGLLFWITPTVIIIAAAVSLSNLTQNLSGWFVGFVATGFLLWFSVIAEYYSLDEEGRSYKNSQLWLVVMDYFLAVAMICTIYQTRARSAVSATGIALICFVLSASLLRLYTHKLSRIFSYSLVIAALCAQVTWAVNYWRIKPIAGGLLISLVFYVLTGFSQQYISHTLRPRSAVGYLLVSVILIFLINTFV
jgi:hypothetical protein